MDTSITAQIDANAGLRLTGPLLFVNATQALAEARQNLARMGSTPLRQLNLAGVDRVDSAGLACILAILADLVARQGRAPAIVNAPDSFMALAKVSGVLPLLDLAPARG